MPPPSVLLLGLAMLGAILCAAGWLWLRVIGAEVSRARRLAGARGMAVADLLDLREPPPRPVRVAGRIRCADPLVAPDDERLVAYHRDVAVQMPNGRWRTIERIRESRSFELWDHAGSLAVDPVDIGEPIISIPLVWEGSPDELEEPHASAVARLVAQGQPPTAARAITRTIPVVEPLLVLARVTVGEEGPTLAPPPGGYLVSTLELDDAMRLLGGSRRGQLPAALAVTVAGLGIGLVGLLGAAAAALAGG